MKLICCNISLSILQIYTGLAIFVRLIRSKDFPKLSFWLVRTPLLKYVAIDYDSSMLAANFSRTRHFDCPSLQFGPRFNHFIATCLMYYEDTDSDRQSFLGIGLCPSCPCHGHSGIWITITLSVITYLYSHINNVLNI